MKRIHKKIISWFLGILCAVSVAFGFVAIPALDANAAETSMTANIQMEEGASVRIGDAAIRFQTYVKKSYVDGLVDPEIGVYVIPQDLLGNGEELTHNTQGVKKISIDPSVWYKVTDTHYIYNAVLYDIESNSYGRQIVARGYVKNGNSYTWADNTQVRSLAYVASAALEDGVNYKGEAFDADAIACLTGYVDGALKDFAFTKDSYTLTVGQNQVLETNITAKYLVDYVDNYVVQYTSDNPAVATVEDGKLVAKSAGIATITATLGSRTDTLLVQVNAENQDIIMTNATIGMNFSIPANYTITDITCAEESWGTNLSALTVSDTLKSDLSKHGENVMSVTLSNGTTLQIPVTLVTGKISSLAEWQSAIQPTAEGEAKYGYYVLANDISVNTNSISVLTANMTATPDGSDGFRGTLDGRGYAFTNTAAWWKFGLFGEIGSGAVIKNITINNTGLAATSNERYILAVVAVGATFENITFNLDSLQNTNALYGALSYNGFRNCKFTDVTINITGTITSLFGGANNITYWGLNGAGAMCAFTNCNVVLMTADSSLGELGHRGDPTAAIGDSTHIKYVASNMSTANGETSIEGVTLYTMQEKAVTLATQEILLTEASHSLDLGQYASYEVQSIMYNGTTDLGTNPSSVVITEADKSKHGAGNSITVVATALAEKVTITIPVVLITKVITTVDELKALMPTGANAVTYGYYVLGNDIGDSDTLFDAGSRWFAAGVAALDGASYGFKATLDGRGHEIIFKISDADNQTNRYGMFGFIGTGAIIKDVTLTNESVRPAYGTYMLAKSIDGATFENVIFKLNNVQHRYANYGVFAQEIVNTTFRNVDIISKATNNVYGNVNVLFTDSGETGNGIFSGNTFENTNVYLYAGASYAGIAKNGTTVYTAEGLEVTGATILEGITVQEPIPETEALTTRQELYLEANSYSIDIGEYSAYTVQSIKLGENDLGTDIANLNLSSIASNTQLHGEQDIIVTLDKGNMGTALTVPVTIVTKIITTADEFMALMPKTASEATFGYYALGNDIGGADYIVGANGRSIGRNLSAVSAELGFRGTIDGRGYTFTFSFAVTNIDTGTTDQFGLFGFMGTGATVKDITLVCDNIRTDTGTHFLGQNVQGANFTNVTVVFNKVYSRYAAALMAPSITNSTFTNVDIVIRNMEMKWAVAPIVFAGAVNSYDGVSAFSGNVFTDTVVHLFTGTSIASLATDGTNTYTELDGVSIVNVTEKEVTLSNTQDIALNSETVSLNLGNYRDYEITSITYGAYDLGTNAKELVISDELKADKQNHGENKTIVVKAAKYADLVSINVPITLITAKISTESEWVSTFMTNTATTVTYGYYVLANDIKFTQHYQDTVRMSSTTTGDYGFRGTLDGRGYGVEITAWTYNGLFGELGAGANIKDVTFTANGLSISYIGHVLGRVVVNTNFTDVTFNLTDLNNAVSVENGALALDGFRSCTFTNVEFNVTGAVASIFGGNKSQYWGLNGGNATCTFTNCYVNLMTEESSIFELGHKGDPANPSTTQYVKYLPTGMAAEDGETVLGGITLRDLSGKVWVLNNNVSPFTIVKPASADVYVNKAVSELQTFFKEATGVELPVITDTGLVHDENATYISLGDTALKSSADLRIETLKESGFYIETKDNTIYVVGGGTKGVLYGAYKLLNEWFGFEVYYKDCYTLNAVELIAFEELSITENPDIAMRSATGLTVNTSDNNYIYADRLQASDSYWAYMLPVVFNENGVADSGHNSLLYLPKSDYYSTYPEFYSNNSDWTDSGWGVEAQLCYTAGGNTTSYSKMIEICAGKIQTALQKYSPITYPNYNNVMIGIQDNYNTCTCSACTAIINQYGSVSATIILFLDDVADAVEAWMAENPTYARDLQYMFFAYQETLKTPTTWPTVNNKIAPFVAMSEMNHAKVVTDTTTNTLNSGLSDTDSINTNAKVLTQLQNWGAWATQNGGGAWAWTYGNFFRDYFCFYDSYDFYQGIMAKLTEYGYDLVYIQQQSKQSGAQSAFISMNIYVATQLAWDSTLDMDTLISNYMTAMYADAADEMLAIFNQSRTLFDDKSMGDLSLGYETPGKKLTYSQIDDLLTMYDEAYAAIAHYEETNLELYTKLKQHIDMEWLSPAKIALVEYKKYFSGSYFWISLDHNYDDIAAKFKTVVAELGITAGAELGTYADINNLLNAL